jgi:hypothetical protein
METTELNEKALGDWIESIMKDSYYVKPSITTIYVNENEEWLSFNINNFLTTGIGGFCSFISSFNEDEIKDMVIMYNNVKFDDNIHFTNMMKQRYGEQETV